MQPTPHLASMADIFFFSDRLRTIISYDRILVLDSGRVAVSADDYLSVNTFLLTTSLVQEFDTPQALYKNEDGIFRSLCEGSNISEADMEKTSL